MKEVLDLESRRRIFDLLTEYPGLHLRELERRLQMDVRGLQYHLEWLEGRGAVSTLREGGYLRYYPREWDRSRVREQFGPGEKRLLAVLRAVDGHHVPTHPLVAQAGARRRCRSGSSARSCRTSTRPSISTATLRSPVIRPMPSAIYSVRSGSCQTSRC